MVLSYDDGISSLNPDVKGFSLGELHGLVIMSALWSQMTWALNPALITSYGTLTIYFTALSFSAHL